MLLPYDGISATHTLSYEQCLTKVAIVKAEAS